eukprot:345874-Chlamydomonas_euryale.AAC.1
MTSLHACVYGVVGVVLVVLVLVVQWWWATGGKGWSSRGTTAAAVAVVRCTFPFAWHPYETQERCVQYWMRTSLQNWNFSSREANTLHVARACEQARCWPTRCKA